MVERCKTNKGVAWRKERPEFLELPRYSDRELDMCRVGSCIGGFETGSSER